MEYKTPTYGFRTQVFYESWSSSHLRNDKGELHSLSLHNDFSSAKIISPIRLLILQ